VAHLPVVSGDDFVKAMRKIGYVWDHTEGSHMVLLHRSKGQALRAKAQRIRQRIIKGFN